jgi:V/A-type H+-transporting ATPase subunit I
MLRPVEMSRVVVAGSKEVVEPVIEKLHEVNLLHIVNFSGGEAPFEMGKPLGDAKQFSEQLIKLRSIMRYLDITSKAPDKQFAESEVLSRMDDLLDRLGDDVIAAFERIVAIDAEIKSKQDQLSAMGPLSVLPLPLELYSGYESLATFVGTVESSVDADIAKISASYEVFSGSYKKASVVAVFVPAEKAGDVVGVLAEHGYSELSIPALSGTPDSAIKTLESEIKSLEGERGPLQEKLKSLKGQNEDIILAAEEYLSIQAQKSEAPLRFASTDNAFVIDGWVPTDQYSTLKSEIESAAQGRIHIEMLEEKEAEGFVKAGEDVPTKMDNPSVVKPYELITRLFAVPEYKEYDPTLLIFLFFPVMFGIVLAMLKKKFRTPGWQSLINIVIIASFWTLIFGFLFGEIFGPLGLWGPMFGEIHGLSDYGGGFYGSFGRFGPAGLGDFTGPMFPMYRLATAAVLTLIGVNIFVAVIHVGLGSILGVKTELAYGEKKHAYFERLPVFIFQVFFVLALLALILGYMPLLLVCAALVIISMVMMVMGPEGVMGVTHVPFFVSNIISYLRILAIGLASVGVAFAGNKLAFQVIMPMLSGGVHDSSEFTFVAIAIGVVVLTVVHFINLLLGILAPFMHPLRLHYVEMFTKFYSQHGGGIEYSPFGHVRRFLRG